MLNITLQAIYKSSKVAKVLLEKLFELWLGNNISKYIFWLVLNPLTTYYLLKKRGNIEDLVWFYYFGYIKVVLILLVELIVLYVKITQIGFRKTSFKELFSKDNIL